MTDQPLITAGVVIAAIALIAGIGATLRYGAQSAGVQRRPATMVVLVLTGWLVTSGGLAAAGMYANEIWLGIGLLIPLVLGLFALRLPAVSACLRPEHVVAGLAAVQIVRLVGGTFLVLLAMDQLPASFARPAGFGDVLVGLLAPFVAYQLWRQPRRRAMGVALNVLGLADLLVAIPLGVLHAPGRLQLIVTDPTTEMMGMLPMALIPTFIVPVAIVAHIASFRLLGRHSPQATFGVTAAAPG